MYFFLISSIIILGIQIIKCFFTLRNEKNEIRKDIFDLLVILGVSIGIFYISYTLVVANNNRLQDLSRSSLVVLLYVEVLYLFKRIVKKISVLEQVRFLKQGTLRDVACEHKFKLMLAPICYFSYVILVSGIFEVYFTNISEWDFSIKAFLQPACIVFGLSIICFLVLSLFIKECLFYRFFMFLCMTLIMSYVQANFLNGRIFLKGNYLQSSWFTIIFNTMFWIIGITYSMFTNITRRKVKVVQYVVLFLLLIQIPVLPILVLKNRMNPTRIEYELDGSEQFEIGSEENVVVFILDAFYSGYFDYFCSNNPEYAEIFSDFIYFDNANSRACSTAFSMPSILTAKDIDYTVPLQESNANNWKSDTATFFYNTMHDNGYTVNLYTDGAIYSGGAENMIGKIDNIKKADFLYNSTSWEAYKGLLKLSLFKVAPFSLKNLLCISDSSELNVGLDNEELINIVDMQEAPGERIAFYNNEYFHLLNNGLHTEKYKKCLVVQHLFGMHEAFEPLSTIDYPEHIQDDGGKALIGCLTIIDQYMNELKKNGIYDTTTIIITADHGLASFNANSPIMFIKPPHRRAEGLEISNAPVDVQMDILPTVLDCLNQDIPSYYEGLSMLNIDENMERARITRAFEYSDRFPKAKKCNGMGDSIINYYQEYIYVGDIKDYDFDKCEYQEYPIVDYWW